MTQLFGIGTYQSLSGGTTVGSGTPTIGGTPPSAPTAPYSGVYGGTYGWVLDLTIRQPQGVVWQPAPSIGMDTNSISIQRGWPSFIWSYTQFRPDFWYYLLLLYEQTKNVPPGFESLVLIQYPDGNGVLQQKIARWEPPTQQYRDVAAYHGITLKFTHIGQIVLQMGTLIQTVS